MQGGSKTLKRGMEIVNIEEKLLRSI